MTRPHVPERPGCRSPCCLHHCRSVLWHPRETTAGQHIGRSGGVDLAAARVGAARPHTVSCPSEATPGRGAPPCGAPQRCSATACLVEAPRKHELEHEDESVCLLLKTTLEVQWKPTVQNRSDTERPRPSLPRAAPGLSPCQALSHNTKPAWGRHSTKPSSSSPPVRDVPCCASRETAVPLPPCGSLGIRLSKVLKCRGGSSARIQGSTCAT